MGAKLCSNNVNEPGLEVKAPTNVFKWALTQSLKIISRRLACTFGGGGPGQGQPQVKVPLPTPQLSLGAPQINHSLPRPPEGAANFPHTSWALPFRIFLNVNDSFFSRKGSSWDAYPSLGEKGVYCSWPLSSCQETLLVPSSSFTPPGSALQIINGSFIKSFFSQ